MKLTIIILFISSLVYGQDTTQISTVIPQMSRIIADSIGFRVLQVKERVNYEDAFYVRHSELLDSNGLEIYLFRIAMAQLDVQEDSTRFNELSDAYTAFTGLAVTEVRRMRVLAALQGAWTVTRLSDQTTWQGEFINDEFSIGQQVGTVEVVSNQSIRITGLSIGDLYLDAINQNTLRSRNEEYLLTRN